MIPQLSIAQLFEDTRDRLQLEWQVSEGVDRVIELKESGNYGSDVVGHLNMIHAERLQVIGNAEAAWLQFMKVERLRHQISDLMAARPPALIFAEGVGIHPEILTACANQEVPVFTTPVPCAAVIDLLRIYLSRRLADVVTMHGVFIDVLGMGVLMTGDSGVGKSELALELISRGHGLVADDIVELARVSPTTIEGRCPGLLRDFLEVRGLGLLNIRTIFGETATRRKMKLSLVVHLQKPIAGMDSPRLPLDAQTQEILGLPVRKVIIPVAAGRNIAVLLEAAVRNTILQMRGIDSMHEFMNRQQRALREEDEDD